MIEKMVYLNLKDIPTDINLLEISYINGDVACVPTQPLKNPICDE